MPDVRELLIQVTGETRQAEQKLNKIARDIIGLGEVKSEPGVEIDGVAEAMAQIEAIRNTLSDLDGKEVDVQVEVEVERSLTRLALLEGRLNKIGDITDRGKSGQELAGVARAIAAVGVEAGRMTGNLARAAPAATTLGDAFVSAFQQGLSFLKQINPALQGLVLVVMASLIPAFIALGSALTGLVIGVTALGVALAAAFGPVVLAGVAVLTRLVAVFKARSLAQQASKGEAQAAAAADDAAAAAAERLHNAETAVRDALESRVAAQRALDSAQDQARKTLDAARVAAGDAARAVGTTLRDAYRAMEDAAEAASDAVRGVQDAQLGLADARLSVREAELALRGMRLEAGAAGAALDGAFRKLTDVDADPGKLRGALSRALPGQDPAQQLELERAILTVQQAKQREKGATDALSDSERDLGRAREEQGRFAEQGIRAYQPYVDALARQAEAGRALREAEQQGIARNPAVIAAQDALRDAGQRVTEAQHDLRRAKIEADAAVADTAAVVQAKEAYDELTTAEQRLVDVLDKIGPLASAAAGAIAGPVIAAVADVLGAMEGLGPRITAALEPVGQAMGDNLRDFAAELGSDPRWAEFFGVAADAARELVEVLGGPVFRDFMAILRDIALAAMPALLGGLDSLRDRFGIWRQASEDSGGFKKTIEDAVGIVGDFIDLIGAGVGVFGALFAADEGKGASSILKVITGALRGISGWLRNNKGTLARFFKDTMPFVQSVVGFVLRLVLLGAQLLQFFAPALKAIFDGFNLILDVINFVLGWLNRIPASVRSVLAIFFPWGGVMRGLLFVFTKIAGVVGRIFAPLGRLVGLAIGQFKRLSGVGAVVRNALRGITGFMTAPFRAAIERLKPIFDTLKTAFSRGFGAIKRVVERIIDTIGRIFGGLTDTVSVVFNGVVQGFEVVFNTAKEIINVFIRGINTVIGLINKIPDLDTPFGKIGFPELPEIPQLAGGGLVTRQVMAMVGEAGREVVLPLRTSVLRQLGQAIASAAPAPRFAGALAGAPAGARAFGDVHVTLPPAPPAAIPDARYQAVQLGRELARRGGGTT